MTPANDNQLRFTITGTRGRKRHPYQVNWPRLMGAVQCPTLSSAMGYAAQLSNCSGISPIYRQAICQYAIIMVDRP